MSVSRIELPRKNCFGYQVRVQRDNKVYSRFFSDSLHNGKKNALKHARALEKKLLEVFPKSSRTGVKTRNNTSGQAGVSRVVSGYSKIDGTPLYYWGAWYTTQDGKRLTAKFSVLKYGEENAKEMAIEARKQWESLHQHHQ
jgi:hypothetical protein